MLTLELSQVHVPPERMRRDFPASEIDNLAASIAQLGLQNPPVVRRNANGYALVSGERRLRAMRKLAAAGVAIKHGEALLPVGTIPATDFGELDPLTAMELELAENAIRQDLTWQEYSVAVERLDSLRRMRASERGEVHTPTDTAREILGSKAIGGHTQKIREAILVAPHLLDPDVAKASTQKEALKIVERKQRELFASALAEKIGVVTSSAHTLIHGDAFEVLPGMPPDTFQIILTDPPYGVNAHLMQPQSGSESGVRHDYDDTLDFATQCVSLLAREGFRVCTSQAHLYMFCEIKLWPAWRDIFRSYGWDVWPFPLLWDKGDVGNIVGKGNGPRYTYETILYAIKGDKPVNFVTKAVIQASRKTSDAAATGHAAAKPVELLSNLLRRSAVAGDRVLDPFCGSFPLASACSTVSALATGIEKYEAQYAQARLRLEDEK